MPHEKLTSYIKHYIKKDKTNSALMLTGDWGTGKSYYIKNNLIPDLKKENYNIILVSLYDLKTTSEISKNIYIELRLKKFQPKNEALATGEYVAKTIFKGVSGVFGFDLNMSESSIKKLYKTVNLSNKLIILDDVERSQINILDLLGYVNSLVEQDNVKVLMIVNEKEFIHYKEITEKIKNDNNPYDSNTHSIREYTEDTIEYLKAKEKTVFDTILYKNDFKPAIKHIIEKYDNSIILKFSNDVDVSEIYSIMKFYNNFNLRSFIFACQKTVDIFEKVHDNKDYDFYKCIFFGILIYSLKIKSGKIINWTDEENYSITLGNEKYPLFRFCFNYIQEQEFDNSLVLPAKLAYENRKLYAKNKSRNDKDLLTLFYYHIHYENEIKQAVQSISKRLDDPNDISFYDYGAIGIYLIIIKNILQINIDDIKSKLINNLKGRGHQLKIEEIFQVAMPNDDDSMMREYEILHNSMVSSLKENLSIFPDFNYLPEQVNKLYTEIIKSNNFIANGSFIQYFDIKKLADLFFKCNPEQKDKIRGIFLSVYRITNIKNFLGNDAYYIEKLKKLIEEDIKKCEDDKIQKLQYNFFIQNLDDILTNLL